MVINLGPSLKLCCVLLGPWILGSWTWGVLGKPLNLIFNPGLWAWLLVSLVLPVFIWIHMTLFRIFRNHNNMDITQTCVKLYWQNRMHRWSDRIMGNVIWLVKPVLYEPEPAQWKWCISHLITDSITFISPIIKHWLVQIKRPPADIVVEVNYTRPKVNEIPAAPAVAVAVGLLKMMTVSGSPVQDLYPLVQRIISSVLNSSD